MARRGVLLATLLVACAGLAGCASLDAEYARAARLFGAAEALREASGTREMSLWQSAFDRDVAGIRAAIGQGALAAHWAEGRSLSPEYAVAYALEQPGQPSSGG